MLHSTEFILNALSRIECWILRGAITTTLEMGSLLMIWLLVTSINFLIKTWTKCYWVEKIIPPSPFYPPAIISSPSTPPSSKKQTRWLRYQTCDSSCQTWIYSAGSWRAASRAATCRTDNYTLQDQRILRYLLFLMWKVFVRTIRDELLPFFYVSGRSSPTTLQPRQSSCDSLRSTSRTASGRSKDRGVGILSDIFF